MKYYETSAEEYIAAKDAYNLHPQLVPDFFPKTLGAFENAIVYGPTGSGKYTQVLSLLKRYSPSELKYEKR
jgi:Cdc6-like AAA superfamily ATPase